MWVGESLWVFGFCVQQKANIYIQYIYGPFMIPPTLPINRCSIPASLLQYFDDLVCLLSVCDMVGIIHSTIKALYMKAKPLNFSHSP